jgi:chromosome segregation ATPase
VNAKESELKSVNDQLDREIQQNKNIEVKTGAAHRESEKKRDHLRLQQRGLEEFTNEVSGQRRELEKADRELRKASAMNTSLAQLKTEKKQRLEEFKELVQYTRDTLKNEFANTDSLAVEAGQIDKMFKEHEVRVCVCMCGHVYLLCACV